MRITTEKPRILSLPACLAAVVFSASSVYAQPQQECESRIGQDVPAELFVTAFPSQNNPVFNNADVKLLWLENAIETIASGTFDHENILPSDKAKISNLFSILLWRELLKISRPDGVDEEIVDTVRLVFLTKIQKSGSLRPLLAEVNSEVGFDNLVAIVDSGSVEASIRCAIRCVYVDSARTSNSCEIYRELGE